MIVWLLSLAALYYGNELIGEELEPYLIGLSGVIILGVGLWMGLQAVVKMKKRQQNGKRHAHTHGNDQHHHGDTVMEHGHKHIDISDHTHSKNQFIDAHAQSHAQEIERRFSGDRIHPGRLSSSDCPAA